MTISKIICVSRFVLMSGQVKAWATKPGLYRLAILKFWPMRKGVEFAAALISSRWRKTPSEIIDRY